MLPTPSPLPATQRYVTAGSVVRGTISFDGRSDKSTYWRGGAAYVLMCHTCGLEPSKLGHASKCMCMCEGCSKPLNGHGAPMPTGIDGRVKMLCKRCGGRKQEVIPIGTVETKAKRPRASATSAAAECTPVATPLILSNETYEQQSARTYISYGHFRSCTKW
jgi:hypothetical protein